jgi:hypothetical protein
MKKISILVSVTSLAGFIHAKLTFEKRQEPWTNLS